MGNPKDDKKKMDAAKKEVQAEVKKLSLKMRKPKEDLEVLLDKKDEINAKKEQSPDDKSELKEIDLGIGAMRKALEKHLADSGKRIDLVLKKNVPDDKKEKKAWEKGFSGAVVDLFKADPGLKIRGQLFLGADVSITKKKAVLSVLTATMKF